MMDVERDLLLHFRCCFFALEIDLLVAEIDDPIYGKDKEIGC